MMKRRIARYGVGMCVGAAALSASLGAGASTLYGVDFPGLTPLFTIDQDTGAVSTGGPTGQDNLGDLTSDTRPGSETLWAIRIASNELFTVDPATGAATSAAVLDSPDNMTSIAFDPVGGKLYGNTSIGFGAPFDALYEINPATGSTTFIGRILFDNVFALGFDQGGNLFGVSDATDDLISIDLTSGNGTFIADLPVGLAFDIASRPEDNTMFLADSGTFSLYTVDTGTGALALVGPYGGFANVVGLAFMPETVIPEASTYLAAGALGGLAAMAEWMRRRRSARR